MEVACLDCRHTARNLSDFRDSALLRLQMGGPFLRRPMAEAPREYVLVQVEQAGEEGSRWRRGQQVGIL